MVNPTYVHTHACMHAGTPHIPPPTRMHAHAHAHANTRTHALMHTRAPFLWQYAYTPPKHSYSSHLKRTFFNWFFVHFTPYTLIPLSSSPLHICPLSSQPPHQKKKNRTTKQRNKITKAKRKHLVVKVIVCQCVPQYILFSPHIFTWKRSLQWVISLNTLAMLFSRTQGGWHCCAANVFHPCFTRSHPVTNITISVPMSGIVQDSAWQENHKTVVLSWLAFVIRMLRFWLSCFSWLLP